MRAAPASVQEGWALKPDEIGLSAKARDAVGLPQGRPVAIRPTPAPVVSAPLCRRVDGGRLTPEHGETPFRDVNEDRCPENGVAAFLVGSVQSLDEATGGEARSRDRRRRGPRGGVSPARHPRQPPRGAAATERRSTVHVSEPPRLRSAAAALLATILVAASVLPVRSDEISVTQWGASLYGAPFAVAMADGDFRKAGIDITGVIGSAGGGTSVRNVLASETPYGEVSTAAALAAIRQGLDIVLVNAATRTVAESSLVTLPNGDVKSLADLVGKKVAITSPKSTSEMVLLLELAKQGIDPSKVQRVASGGYLQGLTMLEQGAVSAAVLIEPLSIVRRDKYRTVIRARDVLPAMTTSVGITTRAFAAAHPEKIRAIIAGRRMGVEAIYADPTASAKILAKSFDMDPALAETAMSNMIAPRMWSQGGFDRAELDRIGEGLKLVGEIDALPDWSALIDQSFLPADLRVKL